jgi:hypothetical protein
MKRAVKWAVLLAGLYATAAQAGTLCNAKRTVRDIFPDDPPFYTVVREHNMNGLQHVDLIPHADTGCEPMTRIIFAECHPVAVFCGSPKEGWSLLATLADPAE